MILKGIKIDLRTIQVSDAKEMLIGTMDSEIMYMTGTKANFTLDIIEKHIQNILEDDSRKDFAICLKDGTMIGDLSILDIDYDNKKAGFRIALSSRDNLSKGYGSQAIKMVLFYVFEELKLNRLQLEVYSHNVRGIHVYENVGFIKEGVLRNSLYYNGTYSDEIIMSILKEDYEKLKVEELKQYKIIY